MNDRVPTAAVTILPANEATWEDLQAIFGERGSAAVCLCQRYKLARGEAFSSQPVEERRERLRAQSDCGNPGSGTTSGVVAYVDGVAVGWCAVEPRPAYDGLVRNGNRAAWVGRDEDRSDETVWTITCVLVRAGYRSSGYSSALVQGASAFARNSGARIIEAYPIVAAPGEVIQWDEIHPGTPAMFEAAGFVEVHAPSKRRRVFALDLG